MSTHLEAAFEKLVAMTIAKHNVKDEKKKEEFRKILVELMAVVKRLFKLDLPEPQLAPYSYLAFQIHGTGKSNANTNASTQFNTALVEYIKVLWEDTYVASSFSVCSTQLSTS